MPWKCCAGPTGLEPQRGVGRLVCWSRGLRELGRCVAWVSGTRPRGRIGAQGRPSWCCGGPSSATWTASASAKAAAGGWRPGRLLLAHRGVACTAGTCLCPHHGGRGRVSRAVTLPPAVFAGVASTVLPSFDFSRKTKIKINEKKTGAQRLPGGFPPGLRLRMLRAGRIQGVGVFHAFPTGLQRRLLPAWGGRGGRARGGGAAEQPCHVLNSVHAGLPRREAGPSMNLPPARTGAGKEYGW